MVILVAIVLVRIDFSTILRQPTCILLVAVETNAATNLGNQRSLLVAINPC